MMIQCHNISREQFESSLRSYPDVVRQHYEGRIKDDKKRAEAVSRDQWRYELSANLEDGRGLELPQLEKLVQWKM
jgi:hypothetical protein